MTCFRQRTVLLGVWTMDDVIWGKYSPKTPQKGAWIGSFKPKCQNLYIAISPELLIRRTSDLRSEFKPRKALRGWSAIAPKQTQHGWRPPSWKSRYDVIFQRRMFRFGRNSAAGCRMTRRLRQNGQDRNRKSNSNITDVCISKPQVVIISAANWDIWTKIGLLIDFDLLKAVTSTNRKPEVVFSGRGRHLEK